MEFGQLFEMEIIPSIQTLAHLEEALKWSAFDSIRDIEGILLVDAEETYEFIEEMFSTLSKVFVNSRINIGMDEAHLLGQGKYLDLHGYQDKSTLMLRHLQQVTQIAKKYNFEPMMWSDMFFRIAAKGEYYDENAALDPQIRQMIPEGLTLIYWDYYSETTEKYDAMLTKHLELTSNISFAGGVWKWTGFCPHPYFSKKLALQAHASLVKHNIKDVMITAWGDNGAECQLFSVLPGLQLWAELCYKGELAQEFIEERFTACAGGRYDDFMNLGLLDLVPDNPLPGQCAVNPHKYIFYSDLLCGLFDAHILPREYAVHYEKAKEYFAGCIERNPSWSYLFRVQHDMAKLLALKCAILQKTRPAYEARDKEKLTEVLHSAKELVSCIEAFLNTYEVAWKTENVIFGLDTIEIRIGGLLQRTKTFEKRLAAYLAGEIEAIAELEEKPLPFIEGEKGPIGINFWHRMVTASSIASI